MPERIGYHRPKGVPSADRIYERSAGRQEDKAFYSSSAWVKLRKWFLAGDPLCKCGELAAHVHHVKPRKTHPELALDQDNLVGRCIPCHNAEDVR